MTHEKLSELTDQELLREAKKRKSVAIGNAVLIGFLIGIVCYSVMENTVGLFTLIPLYIMYKLINRPKYDSQELEVALKERDLK